MKKKESGPLDLLSISRAATTSPDTILIVMDATGARNLSCYGYHQPTTPHLERSVERCVLYEAAMSPAGWHLPAFASMFTGLYLSRHGAHTYEGDKDDN